MGHMIGKENVSKDVIAANTYRAEIVLLLHIDLTSCRYYYDYGDYSAYRLVPILDCVVDVWCAAITPPPKKKKKKKAVC